MTRPTEQAVERAAEKIEARRKKLIALPLSRIYNELARAALSADLGDMVLVPRSDLYHVVNIADRNESSSTIDRLRAAETNLGDRQ